LVLGITLLLTGCASQPTGLAGALATSACVGAITADAGSHGIVLDADTIRVVNWNIQKGMHPDWVTDLEVIHGGADILILQESSPEFEAWKQLAPTHHRSFARGFRGFGLNTGVMTLSDVAPVAECAFAKQEPWIRTPKAMLVTAYGLDGADTTLLVINIHGVNFSFGMRELRRQVAAAERIIAAHRGPVIFSGDFNTWRGGRMDLVQKTMSSLGLEPVRYDVDHRKRFLGWPLDHIYVRGLDVVRSTTVDLDSSDHNPMRVEFRFVRGARMGPVHQ
jgi:endonuclease/exonuclease/phosphatase (EEP) superfamily protein YafD